MDINDAKILKIPVVGSGRTKTCLKTIELLVADNMKKSQKPVFAGCIGPFSLAGRLYDMTEIMVSLMLDPEIVHTVLEKVTQFLINYTKEFKKRGANGIIMAEPAAGLLSPSQCDEFSSAYIKRIVDVVQDDNFMVILHNCGNTVNLVDSMLSTGALGLHFGNAVDLTNILPRIPSGRIAFGNVNPVLFINGSISEIAERTRETLDKTAEFKNIVLSSGCDIPADTPLDNIQAFFEELEIFNSKKSNNKIA